MHVCRLQGAKEKLQPVNVGHRKALSSGSTPRGWTSLLTTSWLYLLHKYQCDTTQSTMPRHTIHPTSRFAASQGSASRRGLMQDPSIWERMDRAQVLGSPAQGHRGCVNALSWSDDGSTLLSGSDDKRICIWASDSSSTDSVSPHPMKLVETIATGHRANIFSARYLPNTNTPTIVSCAGDRDIRVFEVERLGRSATGMGITAREELYGRDGPG